MEIRQFEWTCACCGEAMSGLPAFVVPPPKSWTGLADDAIKVSTDDFFIFDDESGRHTLIRAVIEVPIQGVDDKLEYGVWVSLSAENAKRYREAFDDEDQSKLGGMFGWLASGVPSSPNSMSLPTTVWPRDGRRRPLVEVLFAEGEQPSALWREQNKGATRERVEALLTMVCECGK
ncbi:MAG: DUF2199 domain-containing protein [Rhodobacteraceae bacterium]|nr:DUF2199 domain-containing protein [Paracoccaceae bacterium]